MKVLSNLEFKNSTYILNKFNDFPENPTEGTVIFKENGLYIYSTNITSGNLEWNNILDFTRTNTSYKFEQTIESTEWNITHNLNTQDLFVIVYDSNGNKQIESEIQFQSDNEIKLIFSEPISGKALLFGASVVSSPNNMYTKEEIDELLKNIDTSGGSNIVLPENGVDGYLLSKSGDNLGWTNPSDIGTKLPEGGISGQVLSLDNNKNLKWNDPKAPVKLNVGDLVYTFADTPPSNTLLCDSSIVSKEKYSELYSVIGDRFTSSDIMSSSDKSVVPIYSSSVLPSLITNTISDLSLGEESYYSYTIDNRIKLTCIGINGGIYSTDYHAWKILDDALTETEPYNNYKVTYEIEYLDGRKFAPYMYKLSGGNISYSGYHLQEWDLYGYNGNDWILLDEQSGQYVMYDLQTYKLDSYSTDILFSKFRLVVNKSLNAKFQLRQFYIYATKEGEFSIYDGFVLPPSSTNESGAKACIVHSSYTIQESSVFSEEEMKIGTWIDGKPIYRKVFSGSTVNNQNLLSNIDKLLNQFGYVIDASNYMYTVPRIYATSYRFYVQVVNNIATLICTNNGENYQLVLEYTKTTD